MLLLLIRSTLYRKSPLYLICIAGYWNLNCVYLHMRITCKNIFNDAVFDDSIVILLLCALFPQVESWNIVYDCPVNTTKYHKGQAFTLIFVKYIWSTDCIPQFTFTLIYQITKHIGVLPNRAKAYRYQHSNLDIDICIFFLLCWHKVGLAWQFLYFMYPFSNLFSIFQFIYILLFPSVINR